MQARIDPGDPAQGRQILHQIEGHGGRAHIHRFGVKTQPVREALHRMDVFHQPAAQGACVIGEGLAQGTGPGAGLPGDPLGQNHAEYEPGNQGGQGQQQAWQEGAYRPHSTLQWTG